MYKISIIGIGFVGSAILNCLLLKNKKPNEDIFIYDKYKNLGSLESCLNGDILFIALPTLYDEKIKTYNIEEIEKTLQYLKKNNYNKLVVIKSTIVPNTSNFFAEKYNLNIVHNPEFLSAKTALYDFTNQKHIVIGKTNNSNNIDILIDFYKKYFPDAELSICNSEESELMKLSCNSFYSVKIQFFTELYLLSKKLNNCNYDKIKIMMLKNGWINEQHTQVPGTDGNISYGGMCFPKDTNALNQFMISNNSPNKVLDSTIEERNSMRK